MATFTFNGEQAMVFPTIGVTAQPGDSFDAPDDFTVDGVTSAKASKKVTATIETAPEPATEGLN